MQLCIYIYIYNVFVIDRVRGIFYEFRVILNSLKLSAVPEIIIIKLSIASVHEKGKAVVCVRVCVGVCVYIYIKEVNIGMNYC